MNRFELTYSTAWNIMLITLGSFLFAIAIKSFALLHGFIQGGLFGIALLANYAGLPLGPGAILRSLGSSFSRRKIY